MSVFFSDNAYAAHGYSLAGQTAEMVVTLKQWIALNKSQHDGKSVYHYYSQKRDVDIRTK